MIARNLMWLNVFFTHEEKPLRFMKIMSQQSMFILTMALKLTYSVPQRRSTRVPPRPDIDSLLQRLRQEGKFYVCYNFKVI